MFYDIETCEGILPVTGKAAAHGLCKAKADSLVGREMARAMSDVQLAGGCRVSSLPRVKRQVCACRHVGVWACGHVGM